MFPCLMFPIVENSDRHEYYSNITQLIPPLGYPLASSRCHRIQIIFLRKSEEIDEIRVHFIWPKISCARVFVSRKLFEKVTMVINIREVF